MWEVIKFMVFVPIWFFWQITKILIVVHVIEYIINIFI